MAINVEKMRLKDGRTLAWGEYGDPRGRPVLYFHGAGSSMVEGACFQREAQEHGLRLIATSRPGAWQSMAWSMSSSVRSSLKSGRYAALIPAETEPEIAQLFLESVSHVEKESYALECDMGTRYWGFDHRRVRCPVRILYGESDSSRYLGDTWARELPNGQHIIIPGGHLPIAPAARRILAATWRSLFD